MGINIFLFVWFYLFYDLGDQFFYTRHLLGVSEGVGRDLVKWLWMYFFMCLFSLPVGSGLGQGSSSRPQLQLHADPAAGVQKPAVAHPRLVCGEIPTRPMRQLKLILKLIHICFSFSVTFEECTGMLPHQTILKTFRYCHFVI